MTQKRSLSEEVALHQLRIQHAKQERVMKLKLAIETAHTLGEFRKLKTEVEYNPDITETERQHMRERLKERLYQIISFLGESLSVN